MKNCIIIFGFLILTFFSCNNSEKLERKNVDTIATSKDSNTSFISLKSGMTFFDIDSICKQKFITTSINNGTYLFWEIEIFDESKRAVKVVDSSDYWINYLVDACDLNSDGIGELVIVSTNDKLKCKIYYYIKVDNNWVKRTVPELSEKQLKEYGGLEEINVKKNKIIRKYAILNKEKKETGKERIITYRLNKETNLIEKQEK